MRISDWSSDVCSSDLRDGERLAGGGRADALRASTAGIGIEAARRAVVEAEDPVRLAGHRVLADMFVPRQVADLDRVAEGMAEYRLQRLGLAVLTEIGRAHV